MLESNGSSYSFSTDKTSNQPKMSSGKRDLCCAQLFGVFLFALGMVGGILIGIYAYHGGPDAEVTCKNIPVVGDGSQMQNPGMDTTTGPMNTHQQSTTDTTNMHTSSPNIDSDTCPRTDPRTPWDGNDPEIFAPLTLTEMNYIKDFMRGNGYISLADPPVGDPSSLKFAYITYMYLHPPNKEAVLNYRSRNGPYPGRHATVHVVRGNRTPPDYMQYKVGPLGSDTMTATQLYNDGELHFNSRPFDDIDRALNYYILCSEFQTLKLLLEESFDGASCSQATPDFKINLFYGPPGLTAEEREVKAMPFLNPLGYDPMYFNTLPLAATIHCPGTDTNTWYVHSYYYLNQGPFPNATALMDAYNSGSIRKFALPSGFRQTVLDRHLIDRDENVPFRDRAHIPPPRTYEPEGPRYKVKGHHVEWMGWSFDVSSNQLRGPGLFTVTYKGESIAYEISLNEISVVYSYGAAGETDIIYGDSAYGIGQSTGVVDTVDCPEHATYLETSFWTNSFGPIVLKSMCVFEADGENALARHKGFAFEGGLRNTYLVVRYQAAIGNYDYIVDWHFYLDGRIYTIGSASGYIFGGFWDSENPFMGDDNSRDAFGYKLDQFTHGKMHDHMFGFKVDLDIIDKENTMEVVHWKSGHVLDALRSQVPTVNKVPPFFQHNTTSYVEYEYIETEQAYKYILDNPEFWLVVNEDKRNAWGPARGYQIHPISTAAQTMSSSHPAMGALSFTKNHCTVTKRKEDEQYLTMASDVNRLDKPIGDLEKMLNNETIRKTDIVNWVTVGFIHLPTAEDVPITNRVEAGFMLKPFNFFNKTDIFDLQVYFNMESMNKTERPPPVTPCKEPMLDGTDDLEWQ